MLDTGRVPTIDLNADLGEHEVWQRSDARLLESVTSANISCGFHAGTPEVIRRTVACAVEHGVAVGAHVSFRDRAGFGRRPLEVPPAVLHSEIVEQYHFLERITGSAGGSVAYLKPHGALYHRMAVDRTTADVIVSAARRVGCGVLLAPPGAVVIDPAVTAGLVVAVEGFADRAYRGDGTLVPRPEAGAVLEDPRTVVAQALELALRGTVRAADGTTVALRCDSLCFHGDTPGADAVAAEARAALVREGCTVAAFAPGRLGPPAGDPPPPDGTGPRPFDATG